MSEELTDAQNEQVDHVHGVAYSAMCSLLQEELKWDMEWIGDVADALVELAIEYFDKTEMELYPYMED